MVIGFLKNLLGPRIVPSLVNRDTLIVKPREPFIQWAINLQQAQHPKTFFDPDTGETINLALSESEVRVSLATDHTAYLLPSTGSLAPEEATLRAVYKTIFEQELSDWNTNQKNWPRNRTYELFQAWFDCTYHSSTLDLCLAPLEREPLDDED